MAKNETELALKRARKEVDLNASENMQKAGNYAKGHVKILGFNITIENPKGSYRKGKDRNGKEWKTLMHNDYGYFVRTLGKDGDAIDVFIGPNLKSEKIFPIDQFINGEFDETKVMLGFDNKEEAKKAYLSNYEKDWKGFKYITEVDLDTFKKWLYDGYRQRKPFAKYKSLNESLDELSPNLLQHAADKARSLKRDSQADNLESGATAAVGSEFNEANKINATAKSVSYKNGKHFCTITDEGYYGTKSSNYFADVTNEHGKITDAYFPKVLKVKDKTLARKLALWWNKYGKGAQLTLDDWRTYFDYGTLNETKNYNPPKDIVAAVAKGNRDADIEAHGKSTAFRTTITKNKKKYTRKEKHMKPITLTEGQLRQIIKESIEEFYKGSRKERAAYENACDCLRYGYGFKFWFEKNKELLDNDMVVAERIWRQAKDDLGNCDVLEENCGFTEDVPYREVANKVWDGEYIAVAQVSQIPEDWEHIANVAEPSGNICGRLFKGKETGKIYFFEMGVI